MIATINGLCWRGFV